ncbi:MAG: glyoxalase/bleomycin resistance protein/dioxygenase [bacterium]|nr:MAG: glyoxalase/bleomycin resistance protein/dioxygenase [bacterium]
MKIKFNRLNHVQISIPQGQEEKARLFYSKIIGLEEIEKPDELKSNGGLWFKIAGIELHIGVENNQSKSKRHPAFEVENIDQVKDYLVSRAVSIKEEIPVSGLKRFSFFDPFDNRIELIEIINN